MQFFVNSPHVKEIIVISRAGGSAADGEKKRKGLRTAKLFYLRDSPERMASISAGVR
jgi:large subunit ribosomal protein L19